MQNLLAKGACTQDLRAAKLTKLQESGPLVSSHRVVWLRGVNQIEEKAVGRIGGLMFARQWPRSDCCSVEIVQHCSDQVGSELASKSGVAADGTNFIYLRLACDNSEPAAKPSLVNG